MLIGLGVRDSQRRAAPRQSDKPVDFPVCQMGHVAHLDIRAGEVEHAACGTPWDPCGLKKRKPFAVFRNLAGFQYQVCACEPRINTLLMFLRRPFGKVREDCAGV